MFFVLIVGGIKSFCNDFTQAIASSTTMKDHTNRVHEGTKPFLFDSCQESFAKDIKLKLHIKGMQGGKQPFSCPMCGPQFYFSSRLKDHIEKNHKSQDFTVSGV